MVDIRTHEYKYECSIDIISSPVISCHLLPYYLVNPPFLLHVGPPSHRYVGPTLLDFGTDFDAFKVRD